MQKHKCKWYLADLVNTVAYFDKTELYVYPSVGLKDEQVNSCLRQESRKFILFFSWSTSTTNCGTTKLTEKHEGET